VPVAKPAAPVPVAKPAAPAPIPVPTRTEAPPQAEPERLAEAIPREPARSEPARSPGGPGGGAGSGGGGGGTGSGGGGTGSGAGGGAAAGGGHGGPIALDFSQVKVAFRPPEPPYPPLARMARIQGTVVVELTVGLDGVPLGAMALEGPFQLRAAAQAYAMAWRFVPTREGGQPVVSRFKLSVTYRLN
jgi:protein TonB